MTEYEKDVAALNRVIKAITEGRVERKDSSWYLANSIGINFKYRIKPEPKKFPLELKDWAGGPWWFRCEYRDPWLTVSELTDVTVTDSVGNEWSPQDIINWQRTKDFINIENCHKTE